MDEPITQFNPMNQSSETASEPIVWQAEEFEIHRRGWSWYLIAGLVFAGLIFYSFYIKQWILMAVVVVAGIVLFFSNRLRPRMMDYRIDSLGLSIGQKTFAFNQLKSFWFYTQDGQIYLNLVSVMRLMPVITIKIVGVGPERIRRVLGKFIPEMANQGEDWVDKINRFLKV